jgi:long-subunit acyl-CoA synthetase (AMP-forming)
MASSLLSTDFLISETVDPIVFTAVAVVGGLWLLNKLLSTNPKMKAEAKPYGKLDADGVLWAADSVGELQTTPVEGISTIYDLVQYGVSKNGPREALGKRPLLERHYEEIAPGKEVEKLTYSNTYEWITYQEFGATIASLGAGLVDLGKLKPQDRVIIYAETQREWMLAAQAAFTQSLQVVTVYATLGEEGLIHGTTQTKSKVIVCDAKLLKVVASAIKKDKSGMKSCTGVVFIADPVQKPDPKAAALIETSLEALKKAGIKVITFDELKASGEESPLPPVPPKAEDVAVIMYTSGTTGMPKGVMISHANVVAGSAGLLDRLSGGHITPASGPNETYCAYLPLAHIMEMICETGLYAIGARVGFGSPHTLTPTGVKIKTGTCEGDAACLGPTLMVFAPAVLDKVYAGLNAKIKASKPIIQKLFAAGMAAGEANFAKGVIGAPWFYNKIVFKKVQALLGGKMKFAGTGSAPLAPKAQMFVQTAFNCPVRQGYGLTETCGASCTQNACDNSSGVVGPPTASTVIKLIDWPEGNYLLSDANKPDVMMPRGEVLIGGPMVCMGYLVDPAKPDAEVMEKNKKEFSTDAKGVRWFHTGDIGQITPDGQLQIIDRKKDLVKLQQGEYVALSKVENVLKECPLVELPMCYARSTESFCVALVCPSHVALKALGKSMGLGDNVAELCKDEKIIKEVSKQCLAVCKPKLVGFEIPKHLGLIADTWTPDNDLLTAAMKLKRVPIVAKHKAELDALYSKK